MNFTLPDNASLQQVVGSYGSLVRMNCDSWNTSLLKYGILLVIVGVVLKFMIDYDLLKEYPMVRDGIFFACYLIVIMIGIILIALTFL
jgi:uncharacterized membrane protein